MEVWNKFFFILEMKRPLWCYLVLASVFLMKFASFYYTKLHFTPLTHYLQLTESNYEPNSIKASLTDEAAGLFKKRRLQE
jgi:hypothetical protein